MPDEELAFQEWLTAQAPGLRWDYGHQLLLYKSAGRITSGECKRLIIAMPPRHAKSETVTIRYSAWRLERDRKLNIILGCYNQKLANKFSRRLRAIAEERNVGLAKDNRRIDEWETKSGGGVKAVGVGAGITGFGGDLVIIDDPVKGRAHAESRTVRGSTWDWFNDDIYTRLEPNAAVILIQTRWHEDDLAGRLLKDGDNGGEHWDVLSLPAIAERGEALWPERFPVERLEEIRRRIGSRSFAALYQQQPAPASGGIFSRDWFTNVVAQAPSGLTWARGYDLAVSTKTTADYTASFRCAFDGQGNLYIADGFRQRIEYPDQRRYVIERIRREQNTVHGIESAMHGQALVQDLYRDARARGRPFRSVRVDRDKVTRANSWSGLAEAGKVRLVRGRGSMSSSRKRPRFRTGRTTIRSTPSALPSGCSREKDEKDTGFRHKH